MQDQAISIQKISKAYSIGLKEEKSETLGGAIMKGLLAPVRNFRNLKRLSKFDENKDRADTVFALKDISFDVNHGEAVAIIGHNGAGKSTLLKIISRITDPTSGRIDIHGRISSLLEVGTGFHPDLTGRENVYLNGAILGMRKHEIDRKFEEIVEFSGVHKYIDTPVKRYSSGMRVRLAFAVAAHLEAEILLIDEVLAVGDVEFQKKCLGKMNEVASDGRTVLFVSHNMGAIKELCTRGIVLDSGMNIFDGDINKSITYYLDKLKNSTGSLELSGSSLLKAGQITINDENSPVINPNTPIKVKLPVNGRSVKDARVIFILEDFMGQDIVNLSINVQQLGIQEIDGQQVIELDLPPLWLSPGIYSAFFKFIFFSLDSKNGKVTTDKVFLEVALTEEIANTGFHSGKKNTILAPLVNWNFSKN